MASREVSKSAKVPVRDQAPDQTDSGSGEVARPAACPVTFEALASHRAIDANVVSLPACLAVCSCLPAPSARFAGRCSSSVDLGLQYRLSC